MALAPTSGQLALEQVLKDIAQAVHSLNSAHAITQQVTGSHDKLQLKATTADGNMTDLQSKSIIISMNS